MTWARLDDTFHHHPKPMGVSLSALGLFALGLSYTADNGTRGRLPEKWVLGRIVGDDQSAPQQLVDAGMWIPVENGYEIHDYFDYNLTPEQLEQKRDSDRERKRKQRRREEESRRDAPVTPGTGKGKGSVTELGTEFEDEWLPHYREVTGNSNVRGSKSARDQFIARRREGRSIEELKLATIGCHGDEFCRDHGFNVPDTILRASKVERYIQLGREPRRDGSSKGMANAHRLAEKARQMEEATA